MANLEFEKVFARNYMKIEEIGPGASRTWHPLGSTNGESDSLCWKCVKDFKCFLSFFFIRKNGLV